MINRARRQLRSWMFIYAGLAAAIALTGEPSDARALASEAVPQPVIPGAAPIARRDI
jgi:hypothetical protein